MNDTKTIILDDAERLFATQGYRGTSLRAITRAAGVNLASVSYHFGSKEGLLEAVLYRRLEPVSAARLRYLDRLEAEDSPPKLEDLIRAFVEPPILLLPAIGERGPLVLRLLGRIHTEPEPLCHQFMKKYLQETVERFHAAFSRALPRLSAAEISFRIMALVGIFSFFLHRPPSPQDRLAPPSLGPQELVDAIVAFALPGFQAEPN